MTIAEFLISTFGESAKGIDGIDNEYLGGSGYDRVAFATDAGRICTLCSGECLIGFYHTLARPTYLVRDDRATRDSEWVRSRAHAKFENGGKEVMSEQDWKDYHASTAHPRLRLVQSA